MCGSRVENRGATRQTLLASAVLVLLWCSFEARWASAAGGTTYRIGPGDQLELSVDKLPEMNQELKVEEDGTVELLHVGSILAQGRTERELASEIQRRLEERGVRRALVGVRIRQFSRPVALLGAIVNPGNLAITGRATLLDVLFQAGGLAAEHGHHVMVRRRASNGLHDQVEIPVEGLLELGDPIYNIPIFAGDVIRVPRRPSFQISIIGEVQNTGSLTFDDGRKVTLLVAIAGAGGLTDAASNKIRILRGGGPEKREIVANFRHILSGKSPDVELQDGDIIVVKESFF